MPRLTKSEIEQTLLSGKAVEWIDGNSRHNTLFLSNSAQRRLFAYVLSTAVRQPTQLLPDFVAGLQTAFDATNDPALEYHEQTSEALSSGPWRLHSVETQNFGGL